METYRTKKEKIIDYLFDLLPEKEKREIQEVLNNNSDLLKLYNEIRENIIIESYLDDELLPHDKIEFERILKKESKLAAEVDLRKKVNVFIKGLVYNDELEEIFHENNNHDYSIPFQNKRHLKLMKLIAAASITLLLTLGGIAGLGIFRHAPLENRLYAKYYHPFKEVISNKYKLHTNGSMLTEAKSMYNQGDYYNALLIFKNLPNSLPIEIEKKFYTGLIFMEMGQFDDAIDKFEYLTAEPDAVMILSPVKWYLGLCYLNTDQDEKAVAALTQITENRGYNYKNAVKILKKLGYSFSENK